MRLVIGKLHKHGRVFEAVVMDADDRNAIVYRSGLSFDKRGKADCAKWLRERH